MSSDKCLYAQPRRRTTLTKLVDDGLLQLQSALYGLLRLHSALDGLLQLHSALYGLLQLHSALDGLLQLHSALAKRRGELWQLLMVIVTFTRLFRL